jgi:hypothetical protein
MVAEYAPNPQHRGKRSTETAEICHPPRIDAAVPAPGIAAAQSWLEDLPTCDAIACFRFS